VNARTPESALQTTGYSGLAFKPERKPLYTGTALRAATHRNRRVRYVSVGYTVLPRKAGSANVMRDDVRPLLALCAQPPLA
jgi:hypothetical protein